jgi:dihydroceramide fatty acyl 2-hydroxylase
VGRVISISDPILSAFFWSFFLIGYMTYDICHYSLHHIDTSKNSKGYFHKLQKYHNQHHFGGEEAGFGVSSPLWDIVFRTGYKKGKKGN